jgi:PAS domain S-box-containing protein
MASTPDIAERLAASVDPTDAQFRLLVESVSDYAIYLIDREGRVASWNAGAERIKGYAAGEILGRSFSLFYAPEDRAAGKPAEMLRRAEREGRSGELGWRVRKDGSRFWADVAITALRDASGAPCGFAKVTRDISEARAQEKALQALAWRLVQAEEAERRRIAGELHDRVGQVLSALNIQLDIALGSRAQALLALLEAAVQSVEDVMAELRPPLLDEFGLGAALRAHAEEFERRTGVHVHLDDRARHANRAVPREAAVGLFRIAQEALGNVAKHAGTRAAEVSLQAAGGELVLSVSDTGCGFDPAVPRRAGGWGMTTMKERALAAGGSLHVSSVPGGGTTLTARVPI